MEVRKTSSAVLTGFFLQGYNSQDSQAPILADWEYRLEAVG